MARVQEQEDAVVVIAHFDEPLIERPARAEAKLVSADWCKLMCKLGDSGRRCCGQSEQMSEPALIMFSDLPAGHSYWTSCD